MNNITFNITQQQIFCDAFDVSIKSGVILDCIDYIHKVDIVPPHDPLMNER